VQELSRLSDRELADIGITRCDIGHWLSRPECPLCARRCVSTPSTHYVFGLMALSR
jgi:hypothetical protein